MTDYLELLLAGPEEDEEEVLELAGKGFQAAPSGRDGGSTGQAAPAGTAETPLSAAVDGGAEGVEAGLVSAAGGGGVSAPAGQRGKTASGSGAAPENSAALEAARLERAVRRRTLRRTEAAERSGRQAASGSEEAQGGALALSGALGALRRSARRAERLTETNGRREELLFTARPIPEGERDPVSLVDAAFQRDARRYDGALGLY